MANYDSFSSPRTLVQTFIQRVYQWMAGGLVLTGMVAYWASSNLAVMRALQGGTFFILAIAEIGIVFWLSSQISRISAQAAMAGFLIYAALNGLTLSFIFLVYTHASIANAFFITAGTFAAMSLFGWTTKTDLTSLGGFLAMALIGVLIASVVNLFLHSPVLYWVVSYLGVGVFIVLTAYDTQRLKAIHESNPEAPEQLAIVGALSLYLDFINMFIMLLRIFGNQRR